MVQHNCLVIFSIFSKCLPIRRWISNLLFCSKKNSEGKKHHLRTCKVLESCTVLSAGTWRFTIQIFLDLPHTGLGSLISVPETKNFHKVMILLFSKICSRKELPSSSPSFLCLLVLSGFAGATKLFPYPNPM